MIRNYLTVAYRQLVRNKVYSAINIVGLALGMASALYIFAYIYEEVNYDNFHEKSSQIYRVTRRMSANTPRPLGPAMQADLPEVLSSVRLELSHSKQVLKVGDKSFNTVAPRADNGFLKMFTFPIISGDAATALAEPNTLVITETAALNYFGHTEVIGEIAKISDEDHIITAVIKDVPKNSHIQFEFLRSYTPSKFSTETNWTTNPALYTYIETPKGYDINRLVDALPAFTAKYMEVDPDSDLPNFTVMPFGDIYLHSTLYNEGGPIGSIKRISVFATMSLLLLIIAAINYLNLSTANATRRMKEVGVRKAVGADNVSIRRQFYVETAMVTAIAALLTLILLELIGPSLNQQFGLTHSVNFVSSFVLLGTLLISATVLGLMAGIYPAFYLSKYRPSEVLGGGVAMESGRSSLRQGLVILQYVVSIGLIVGSMTIYRQINYATSQPLGFDSDQVLVLPLSSREIGMKYPTLQTTIQRLSTVDKVSASSDMPGRDNSDLIFIFEGAAADDYAHLQYYMIEPEYTDLMDIPIVEGRSFEKDRASDLDGFIINKATVALAQEKVGEIWDSPIGMNIEMWAPGSDGWAVIKRGPVIGVTEDFHIASLHDPINPMAMILNPPRSYRNLVIKLHDGINVSAALKEIEGEWSEITGGAPFDYYFLDDDFQRLYSADQQLGWIIGVFSILAVAIASLGLLGLAAYSAQRRTKEIGIRKVLGATTGGIINLVSAEFVKLVLVANLIAWPLAWYAMNGWLQGFAYRIELGIGTFVIAGFLGLTIAVATVSSQAVKAATANPIDALRYE